MKYKFRGQLNNKDIVDIYGFEGECAVVDLGKEQTRKVSIDEFNCIFYPAASFKAEVLNIAEAKAETEESIEPEELLVKTSKRKKCSTC